ncbi:MAG: hypothetical protein WD638_12290 [Nitriliruptoraceae bacterium]
MRRMLVLFVAFALLLALPGLASAQAASSGESADLVLAAEGEPVGPEPAPRDQEDNPARQLAGYEDQETPFTWGAAWLLAALGFVGLAVMLAVYRVLVVGPSRDRTSA